MKAAHPDALPIAGGTDVMVEINFDRVRPAALLDLTGIRELAEWSCDGSTVRLGAAVPYARVISELAARLPGLALASRTVGSPQMPNRGTVGGPLGSASSVRGARQIPVREFYAGVKRTVLAPDELIAAICVPVARGPQQFAKVGVRNAMVIAVSSFAIALHPDRTWVGTGLGSAAPTPRPAREAEEFLTAELIERGLWDAPAPLADSVVQRFGELV